MNPRKLHISPALALGLAALLVVGCLLAAIGVSFARYRTEEKGGILFQPARTPQVYLGYVADGKFHCRQSNWVVAEDTLQLPFAVSNAENEASYAAADQRCAVRLIASLGAWQAGSTESVYLTVAGQTYTAVAERIPEGSALDAQFGDGWIFRFLDEAGNEPMWELPGGSFCSTEMLLQVNAAAIVDTGLLQLQVIGETI